MLLGSDSVGFLRSTSLPLTGAASAQLPARSHTWREPVVAFAFSVPAATVVESAKTALSAFSRPGPPRSAEQPIVTWAPCHGPSGALQCSAGAVLSIRTASVFCGPVLPAL